MMSLWPVVRTLRRFVALGGESSKHSYAESDSDGGGSAAQRAGGVVSSMDVGLNVLPQKLQF